MFRRGLGMPNISMIPLREMTGGAFAKVFTFDPDKVTFTPYVDKRSTTVFATSPLVQGNWASSNQSDLIEFVNSTTVYGYFAGVFDVYQGSVVFWITPEWDGNDGKQYRILYDWSTGLTHITKTTANYLQFVVHGVGFGSVDVSGWVAGTTYCVVCRWDSKNTLDGTNYACVSINDAHTFGDTTTTAPTGKFNYWRIGSQASDSYTANAIIQGLTVYRRPLFDGTYGTDVGNGDEINLIYAAGAGKDPCLVTGGSWDIPFCLPTNSTAEALATGTGEAWSHPHSSNLHEHGWMEDGGYLGDQWALNFDAITDSVDCGSGATLDDMPDGANGFTADVWIRPDTAYSYNKIFVKGNDGTTIGWALYENAAQEKLACQICYAGGNALSVFDLAFDGKWHHVVISFKSTGNGGDGKIYASVDGKWASSYTTQTADGGGAYVSDAAVNLKIGNRYTSSQGWLGCIGWSRFSNINTRYTVGTDFVPPRTMPAADGNTIEQWAMNDGSGPTVTASVTSPGNDGTITGATWERQWDQFASPVVPYSLEFDGTDTFVNCGDAADIQDVASGGVITVEAWVLAHSAGDGNLGRVFDKSNGAANGFSCAFISGGGTMTARVNLATTDATVNINFPIDYLWHHLAMTYDDATKTIKVYLDGVYQGQGVGAGAYATDVGLDLKLGQQANTAIREWDGLQGWFRLSDNIRYTANFTPPSRLNPPAVDGNTLRQFNYRDGAGTTLTDATGTANGTITMGAGKWNKTPDLAVDTPGSRVFNWGYTIGNDAVDEGIVEYYTGIAAGSNRVHRPVIRYETDHRAQPYVEAYDDTNGASISKFDLPWLNGTHDGGNNSATLSDSTAPNWPVSLVGATVYNITDGSSATITAIAGNTVITAALAGGTDNDWDNGDEYRIFPDATWAFAEPWTFELPTIARNGVAADCTAYSIRVANDNDEGVFYVLQMEQLENLVDNPSLETGAGNPWIPDGWTNGGLGVGESVQEVAIVHSGGSAIEIISGVTNKNIQSQLSTSAGKFLGCGGWFYGDNAFTNIRGINTSTQGLFHYSATAYWFNFISPISWEHEPFVMRAKVVGPYIRFGITQSGVVSRYLDDAYAFELDDVSLTVTPASQANSVESGGLRVDGRDQCSQPIPAGILSATSGHIRFKYRPRHSSANARVFGNTAAEIMRAYLNINNQIIVYWSALNTITLYFNDGGGAHNTTWNAAGVFVPDTDYLFDVVYDASQMQLLVDNVVRATITTPINFASTLPTMYWGVYPATLGNQPDAVFIAP